MHGCVPLRRRTRSAVLIGSARDRLAFAVRRTSGLLTEDLYLRLVAIAQSAAGALLSNRYPSYRPHTCCRYASARACCANSHMLVRLIVVRGTDGPVFCRGLQHDATCCNPMQRVAAHCCNTLQYGADMLQHSKTCCNTVRERNGVVNLLPHSGVTTAAFSKRVLQQRIEGTSRLWGTAGNAAAATQ